MPKVLSLIFILFFTFGYSQNSIPADTSAYSKIRLYIKDINTFIKTSPDNPEHYYTRGEYYMQVNDLKRAIADFTKSITLSKETLAAPYYKRAAAYDRLGDRSKALADLTKVTGLMPNWEWGYNDRGMIYLAAGQLTNAEADLKKAVALKPNWTVAYANLARIYDAKKDTKQALENYTKAVTLDDSNYPAHNGLGLIYYSNKQYDKAIEHYNRAIGYAKTYGAAYYNVANAYIAKGDTAAACTNMKKAAKLGIAAAASFIKASCNP